MLDQRGNIPALSLGCRPCSLSIFPIQAPDMPDAEVEGCRWLSTPNIYSFHIYGKNRKGPAEAPQGMKLE